MSGSRSLGAGSGRSIVGGAVPTAPVALPLAVWTTQTADVCRLEIRGELCIETIVALERHIDLLAFSACQEVILDVSDLTRLDDVGAHVLVGICYYIGGRGAQCRVANASPSHRAQLDRAVRDIDICDVSVRSGLETAALPAASGL